MSIKQDGGEVELKKYICVELDSHKKVGETIEEWQKNGWSLHTYQAAGIMAERRHYLLSLREATS